jgi:hypothetical protein
MGALFRIQGRQDVLEVYEDRLTITPIGLWGFINKGIKGTKEIPFTSISALQLKKAGLLFNGYLQFTILGGNESRRGIFAASKDENTFMFSLGWPFSDNNSTVSKIKEHISLAIRKPQSPQTVAPAAGLSDELQTLVRLKQQGMLSEEEFQSAKRKLIG